jgi:hypothetical protein
MTDMFPITEPIPVTLEDQVKCVEREISMRERVYPRWVADKKLTQSTADRELNAMRAVLRTLKNLLENPTP